MQLLLEAHGFAVRAVGSYRQALSTATHWLPDVLVSDIDLPGKDGIQLMKTLRSAHPNLRGIAISGWVAPEDAQRSRDAGFCSHLNKPIAIEQLIEQINAHPAN